MNNLDLRFEYKVITDIAKERGDDSGYAPVPVDKIVVEGNTVSIVELVPPETHYKLRVIKDSQWIDMPVWKTGCDGVIRLSLW